MGSRCWRQTWSFSTKKIRNRSFWGKKIRQRTHNLRHLLFYFDMIKVIIIPVSTFCFPSMPVIGLRAQRQGATPVVHHHTFVIMLMMRIILMMFLKNMMMMNSNSQLLVLVGFLLFVVALKRVLMHFRARRCGNGHDSPRLNHLSKGVTINLHRHNPHPAHH